MDKDKYKDPNWLYHMYHEVDISTKEMASMCDVSRKTIYNHMDKNNIERNDSGPKLRDERLKDEEWCREQYIKKQKSINEIAEDSPSSYPIVYKYITGHGIETRQAGGSELNYKKLGDKEFLKKQYGEKDKTYSEIADMVGCTPTPVHRALVRHGMKREGEGLPTGKDHWNYQGGPKESIDYGPSWREQRRKALERADYQCEHTGISQEKHKEKYGKGLDVHHIKPFREFGVENHKEANRLDNLRVLSCKEHGNWERIPVIPQIV